MKNIYIIMLAVFLAVTSKLQAQAIVLEEEFNGGTTAPTGWSFNSISSTGTTVSTFGKTSPSLVVDAGGDAITSATFAPGTANAITFWARSVSGTPSAGNFFTVEFFSNFGGSGSWYPASPGTFTFNSTARMFESDIDISAEQVRITYQKAFGGVNAYVDDLTLLNNTSNCSTSSFLWFTSVVFNSCSSSEGTDEFLSFQNGSTALNVADLEINVPVVGGTGLGTTICGNTAAPCDQFFISNATTAAYLTSLNAATGCTGFFLEPPSGTIPANGKAIVFMGTPTTPTSYDFSSLCASGGNYYCVFVNNTDATNRYANTGSGRIFTTIRNRITGCSIERSLVPSSGTGSDGDMVLYNITSGASSYTVYAGCSGFSALPITLTDFYAKPNQNSIQLNWHIETEINVDHYIIERSNDGLNFSPVSKIKSIAETNGYANLNYSTIDYAPKNGINYYRLVNVDKDASINYNKTILVNFNQTHSADVWVNQTETDIIVSHETSFANKTFYLMDIKGKKIGEYRNLNSGLNYFTISKLYLPKGLYVIGCIDGNMPPQKILITY